MRRLLPLFYLLICAGISAEDKKPDYHLIRTYLVGDSHTYQESTKILIKTSVDEAELTVDQIYKEDVVEVDGEGNIQLRVTMSEIKAEGAAHLLAFMDFTLLEGKSIGIHLRPDRMVKKVTCPEDLNAAQQNICALIKKQLTTFYSMNLLPRDPVKLGESWELTGTHSAESLMGPLDFIMTTKGKIESVDVKDDAEFLNIRFESQIEGTLGMGRMGSTKSQVKGTFVIDASSGRVIRNDTVITEITETIDEQGEKTQYQITAELNRKAIEQNTIR